MSTQKVPGRHQPVAAKSAVNTTQDPAVSERYRGLVDPQAVLRRVLSVNLSETRGANRGGGASTAADFDGLPSGSLVRAYNDWQRSPSTEEQALEKSRRRIVKQAKKGHSAPVCIARGYLRYVESGGRQSHAAWTRAVAP